MTAYLQELFQFRLFKPKQGRRARQATLFAIGAVLVAGALYLNSWLKAEGFAESGPAIAIPVMVLAVTGWMAWRLIQLPKFAEFLIAVEAEMTKVSWPSQSELVKASGVVIFVIFGLAGLLFVYDIALEYLLAALKALPTIFG